MTDTEIVTLRVRAQGRIASIDWNAPEAATAPNGAAAGREVYAGGGAAAGRCVHRAALRPDAEIAPETIVEQEDATIVVPAGWRGRVGAGARCVLEREEA